MAGLLSYAAAGALSGAGQGIVDRAKAMRDAALAAMESDAKTAEGQQAHDWRMEEIAARKAPGASSGSRKSSGRASSAAPSAPKSEPLMGQIVIDGVLHGRTRSGEVKPYLDATGKPVRPDAAGRQETAKEAPPETSAPQISMAAPEMPAPSGAPRSGEVVDGYKFKGGDPNDPNNWEEV